MEKTRNETEKPAFSCLSGDECCMNVSASETPKMLIFFLHVITLSKTPIINNAGLCAMLSTLVGSG